MRLDLSKFFDEMLTYFQFSGEIDESEIDLKNRGAKIIAPIQYEGEAYKLDGGEYRISIDITYTYEEPCSRCLEITQSTNTAKLEGELIRGREEDFQEDEDEELENFIFFENDVLDLSKYVLGEIYLSMPIKTLCKNDCSGLCSVCGVDLNKEECDCERDFIDPRLAKLKDFFPEE